MTATTTYTAPATRDALYGKYAGLVAELNRDGVPAQSIDGILEEEERKAKRDHGYTADQRAAQYELNRATAHLERTMRWLGNAEIGSDVATRLSANAERYERDLRGARNQCARLGLDPNTGK